MNPILAVIEGKDFLSQLLMLLVIGIAAGVLYVMGRWFATRPGIPPVAVTIWNGLFVLIGGIIIINFLLGLAGKEFIRW